MNPINSVDFLQQQTHHHCGQALQAVAKASSFTLALKYLYREDSSRKTHLPLS